MRHKHGIIATLIAVIALAAVLAAVFTIHRASKAYEYRPDETVRIIFDTDIDTDVDDMGALAVLHSFIREGKAELLAAVGSCRSGYAAACLDAVNTWYGLPDVPVGVAPDCPSSGESKYQRFIAENFKNDTPPDEQAEPALNIYRKCLAKADADSVVIVVVGPLNNLRDLLCSESDMYSDQSGTDLVKEKVKLCVVMGGQFPESSPEGEYNFRLDPAATKYVAQNCPVSVMWCGWEVGSTILAGSRIQELTANNPVRVAYERYGQNQSGGYEHPSWDLTAVLYAVQGASVFWDEEKGCVLFPEESKGSQQSGYNGWKPDSWSKDAHLRSRWQEEEIARVIDERILQSEG